MSSYKQIEANRRNAARSTGPRTAAGKLRSRQNAVRHGLTAETVVTAMEDAAEFKVFEAAISDDYRPKSVIEHLLVARLASLLWRLQRAASIETGLFQMQAESLRRQKLEKEVADEASDRRLRIFRDLLGTSSDSSTSEPVQVNLRPEVQPQPPTGKCFRHDASRTQVACATIFLRLCNLDSVPIERISRYETMIWRQAAQTLLMLETIKGQAPLALPRSNKRKV